MIQFGKLNYQQLRDKFKINSPWDKVIIFILSVLFTIPIFLIGHQNLIDFSLPKIDFFCSSSDIMIIII